MGKKGLLEGVFESYFIFSHFLGDFSKNGAKPHQGPEDRFFIKVEKRQKYVKKVTKDPDFVSNRAKIENPTVKFEISYCKNWVRKKPKKNNFPKTCVFDMFYKSAHFGGKSHQAPKVGIRKKEQKTLIFRVFLLFLPVFCEYFAKSYLRRLVTF